MPDAKDNAKQRGDIHPPEVGDDGAPDTAGAHGTPPDSQFSRDVENAGREGKRVEQAGFGKDKDAPGLQPEREQP